MNRSWHWQLQQHRDELHLADTAYSVDCTLHHSNSLTTTMDPTTLVTFLFKAPPEARAVELLGSWDNFSQPYPMNHDRRRGKGYWSGCFKFHNIIFDGDSSYWTKPRTGGLKQGGTYWYYYRLNDEVEAYDDSQNYTSTCPLLPGQTVNVIDVPIEMLEPPTRCMSASYGVVGTNATFPITHTLDPGDKFNALEPPPVSKVHGRCVSDLELNGRLESKAQSFKDRSASPPESSFSGNGQSNSPLTGPPERYYAVAGCTCDAYSDSRSSLYSGRSWRSAAPSFAHSSVFDAYGADSTPFDVHSFDLPPLPEVPSPVPDPPTAVPCENYNAFQSGAHDDELADCNGLSWLADDRFQTSSNAPASISNVQFFGSRPTTSHSGTPSYPRVQRWQDIEEYREPTVSKFEDWASESEVSPRQSADRRHDSESEAYDMLSPTFSAATMSSGGVNTPFRLSVGCLRTATGHTYNDDSIERVADRLRFLGSEDQEPFSPIYERDEPAFSGYSLPDPEAAHRSTHTLGKLSSAHESFAHDVPLPSVMQETQTGSFADDIFSELGFLGRSIA